MRIFILQGTANNDHQDTKRADGTQIPRNPTSFVNESYAKEGTNGHDWTLESVHKELLLGGNYASVLGHQWHIVAEQDQYGDWIGVEVTLPSWRNIELSKESDAKN
jgi:hypothetical protein